jgi:gamma-glutamyltranspeptidase
MSSNFIYQKRQWLGAGRPDCIAERGMIASKHPLIGEAGLKMIQKGGNAVDAAVAAAFMDCVVEPASNGIGGEGVLTIHLSSGENVVVDYVGRPAKSCTPDMFEIEEETEPGWMGWWKVKGDANVVGHKACTTPGTVAGLAKALEMYGTLSLEDVLAPAINVAEEGFVARARGFGSGVVIPGTGILMNNAMYGLNPSPGTANSIDGRKRRIQNVCPTVVLKDGEPFLALGAPGGRAIQISIAQVISHVIDHGMGIQEAIEAPRIFRETSTVYADNRFPDEVRDGLVARGHDLVWVEQEIQNWARPVGVLRDPETGLLHGGVQCHLTGFESVAIGL